MGVTTSSFKIIERLLSNHKIQSVCEIGAQTDYRDEHIQRFNRTPNFVYPYFSDYWKNHAIKCVSIDMNGENDSIQWDPSGPINTMMQFDLVTDFGTIEHIKSLYMGLLNMDRLCKQGGFMIHRNPKTDNWPVHGYHFFTMDFWHELAKVAGYTVIDLDEEAAMGNSIDGWEVYCILRKNRDGFISEGQMPEAKTK